MIRERGFWDDIKNLPILLSRKIGLFKDNYDITAVSLDTNAGAVKTAAENVGAIKVGCSSVQTPNGVETEFTFMDRTTTLIEEFLPNSETVFLKAAGALGGVLLIQGVNYMANSATATITIVPPLAPGQVLMMNCQVPVDITFEPLVAIDSNKWDDPFAEIEEE